MHRKTGPLFSGKRNLQEKLQKLEEERSNLISTINAFVDKAIDAGKDLMKVDNRTVFLNHYQSVSQQLQTCIDSLFVCKTTLSEGSDDDTDEDEKGTKGDGSQLHSSPAMHSELSICSEGIHSSTSYERQHFQSNPTLTSKIRSEMSSLSVGVQNYNQDERQHLQNLSPTIVKSEDGGRNDFSKMWSEISQSSEGDQNAHCKEDVRQLSQSNTTVLSPIQLKIPEAKTQSTDCEEHQQVQKVIPAVPTEVQSKMLNEEDKISVTGSFQSAYSGNVSPAITQTDFSQALTTVLSSLQNSKKSNVPSEDGSTLHQSSMSSIPLMPSSSLSKTLSASPSISESPTVLKCDGSSMDDQDQTAARPNDNPEHQNQIFDEVNARPSAGRISSDTTYSSKSSFYTVHGLSSSSSDYDEDVPQRRFNSSTGSLPLMKHKANESKRSCKSTTLASSNVLPKTETTKSSARRSPNFSSSSNLPKNEACKSSNLSSSSDVSQKESAKLHKSATKPPQKKELPKKVSSSDSEHLPVKAKRPETERFDLKPSPVPEPRQPRSNYLSDRTFSGQSIPVVNDDTKLNGARSRLSSFSSNTSSLSPRKTMLCQKGSNSDICVISPPSVYFGRQVDVVVTSIRSPSDFHVQIVNQELQEMFYDISLRLGQNIPSPMRGPLHKNTCCILREHNVWQRAKIIQVSSDESVEVSLVDVGHRYVVPVSHIYELDPLVARFQATAIPVTLKGVDLPDGHAWSKSEVEHFQSLIWGRCLKASFHSVENGVYPVELVVQGRNIGALDVATLLNFFRQSSRQIQPCPTNSAATISSDCSSETADSSTGVLVQQNRSGECDIYRWEADIAPAAIKPKDNKIVLIVSAIVSPGEFYVHVVEEGSQLLDDLTEHLNEFYGGPDNVPAVTPDLVRLGSCWCTQFSADKFWNRVRIIDIAEVEKDGTADRLYKVHFVDFGNTEQVRLEDLRPLTGKFIQTPAFAVRCSLAYIKPTSGTCWGTEATNRFRELTGFEKCLTADIDSQKGDANLSVFLWDNDQGKDIMINFLLIDEKLAVATLSEDLGTTNEDGSSTIKVTHDEIVSMAQEISASNTDCKSLVDWDPMSSDFNSLRNNYAVDPDEAGVAMAGYKAKDEQYICHYFSKNGRCRDENYCRFKHVQPSIDGITIDKCEESICRNSIQLPMKKSLVYVQISAMFTPNHFYVVFPMGTMHAACLGEILPSEEDELNDLLDEIHDHYSKFKHTEDLTVIPALGSMVAVYNQEDNRWYRARVCTATEESTVVFFVDSGHRENVDRRNIRRLLPKFLNLPGQAVESFMNIKPKTGSKWSEEARAFFKELTEEKLLLAEILSVGHSSLYIDLYGKLDEEDLHIATVLVAKEFAVVEVPKKAEFPLQNGKEAVLYLPG